MKISKSLLFILFAVIGFGLMLWSAQDWFTLMLGEREGASFCSINAYWDCDRVSLTEYGSLFGLPIGFFGALWFVVGTFFAFSKPVPAFLLRVHLILGAVVSLFLASQLILVLKAGCLVCYLSYLCIFGMLLTGYRIKDTAPQFSLGVSGAVAAGFAFILALVVIDGRSALSSQTVSEAEFQRWIQSMSRVSASIDSPFRKGNPEAPVKVVEFAAFSCGHCQRAAVNYRPFLANYADKIDFHFIPFPFDSSCNPSLERGRRTGACETAKIGFCALEQDKFWAYHNFVFQRAAEGSRPKMASIARGIGADLDQMKRCMEKPETENEFQKLMTMISKADVKATPTFLINGRKVEGYLPVSRFRRLVDQFLSRDS